MEAEEASLGNILNDEPAWMESLMPGLDISGFTPDCFYLDIYTYSRMLLTVISYR